MPAALLLAELLRLTWCRMTCSFQEERGDTLMSEQGRNEVSIGAVCLVDHSRCAVPSMDSCHVAVTVLCWPWGGPWGWGEGVGLAMPGVIGC